MGRRKMQCIEKGFIVIDLLLEWRDEKKITGNVFNKVAREKAIKLSEL